MGLLAGAVVLAGGSIRAEGTAEGGRKVYAAQKCSICHSIADVGNKKGPLDAVGGTWTPVELRRWITNAPEMAAQAKAERKPAMKAFADLPKSDVDDLVAYLTTLTSKK